MDFAAIVINNVVLLDKETDKDIIDKIIPLFLQSITQKYYESIK